MNRRTGFVTATDREDILDIIAKVLLLRTGTAVAITWDELDSAADVECTIAPTSNGLHFHITNQN